MLAGRQVGLGSGAFMFLGLVWAHDPEEDVLRDLVAEVLTDGRHTEESPVDHDCLVAFRSGGGEQVAGLQVKVGNAHGHRLESLQQGLDTDHER